MSRIRHYGARPTSQQGMALLIALVVLVVVSILGVVSMRTALFQNRVSINNQVQTLTFQSAESGLQAAMAFADGLTPGPDGIDGTGDDITPVDPNHLFGAALTIEDNIQRVCVDAAGVVSVDGDHGVRVSDEEISVDEPCDALPDSPVRTTVMVGQVFPANDLPEGFDPIGGGSLIVVQLRAEADVPNTNAGATHVEEWWAYGAGGADGF